jgi:hypothetical protein
MFLDNIMTESTSVEEQKTSSWFSNFGLSPSLTNQLSNLSSSILQATTKVSNAATALVQKSMPQRPSTPNENEEQTTETTKDFSSMFFVSHFIICSVCIGLLSDLGSSVLKSAQQLRQVVEGKTILGDFTKEQDKFLTEKRTQQRREESAVPPWVGYNEEEDLKKQILALSQVCYHRCLVYFEILLLGKT